MLHRFRSAANHIRPLHTGIRNLDSGQPTETNAAQDKTAKSGLSLPRYRTRVCLKALVARHPTTQRHRPQPRMSFVLRASYAGQLAECFVDAHPFVCGATSEIWRSSMSCTQAVVEGVLSRVLAVAPLRMGTTKTVSGPRRSSSLQNWTPSDSVSSEPWLPIP